MLCPTMFLPFPRSFFLAQLPPLSWCYTLSFLLELPKRSWCYTVNFLSGPPTRSWCYALNFLWGHSNLLLMLCSCLALEISQKLLMRGFEPSPGTFQRALDARLWTCSWYFGRALDACCGFSLGTSQSRFWRYTLNFLSKRSSTLLMPCCDPQHDLDATLLPPTRFVCCAFAALLFIFVCIPKRSGC
jgi:hypothetical protein